MEQHQENTRDMPKEREEPNAETEEMKEEILRQIIQLKTQILKTDKNYGK